VLHADDGALFTTYRSHPLDRHDFDGLGNTL
jgi:hypothetical protein